MPNTKLCPKKALLALFNQKSSSDLTLAVEDPEDDFSPTEYFCHQAVLIPICSFLQRCLRLPNSRNDGKPFKLPDSLLVKFKINSGYERWIPRSDLWYYNDDMHKNWFRTFLLVAYGLYDLDRRFPFEIFHIASIAHFMGCEAVKEVCDEKLCSINYDLDAIEVLEYSRKFDLPKTSSAAKKIIAKNLIYLYICMPRFEAADVVDIIKQDCGDSYWKFKAVLQYTTGGLEFKGPIKADAMRDLFQSLVPDLCLHWDLPMLNSVMKEIRAVGADIIFAGADCDQAFLFRMLNECYFRLYAPVKTDHQK